LTSNDRLSTNPFSPQMMRGVRHHFRAELPALDVEGDYYKGAKSALGAFEALAALPEHSGTEESITKQMGKPAFESGGLKSYLSCVRYGLVDYYVFGAGRQEPKRIFLPKKDGKVYRLELLDCEIWAAKADPLIKEVTKRRGNPIVPIEVPVDEKTLAEELPADGETMDEADAVDTGQFGQPERGLPHPIEARETQSPSFEQYPIPGTESSKEDPQPHRRLAKLAVAAGLLVCSAMLFLVWSSSERPSASLPAAPAEEVAVGVAFLAPNAAGGRKLLVPEYRGELTVVGLVPGQTGEVQFGPRNQSKLAIALVSSRAGHFYVFDREIYQDDSVGDSFPVYPIHGQANPVDAGMPSLLPSDGGFWEFGKDASPQIGNKPLKGEEFLLLYATKRWTNFPDVSKDEPFEPKLLPGASAAMQVPSTLRAVATFSEVPGGAVLQKRFRLGESSLGGVLRLSAPLTKEGIAALRLRVLY
jgi:hypothetical protein